MAATTYRLRWRGIPLAPEQSSHRLQDRREIATTEAPIPDVGKPISLEGLGRAIGHVSWTVIDQALLSLSTFGANLVLALWLTPTEYGGYMAASAAFWITLSIHSGMLVEPMMVFGSRRFHDRPFAYLAVLTNFHWCMSAIISAGLAACGMALMFWGSRMSGSSMLGYAVAAPLLLLLGLLRRTFYVWSHPRRAAGAGAIYMVGLFAILYTLYRSATLSSFTAPLAAAGASVLAIASIIAMRRFQLWSPWRGEIMREVAAAHWRYGRWAALTGIVAWAPGGLYYLIVPVLVGLEANAALNVLWNLITPANQFNLAITALLVPTFSRARQARGAAPLMWIALLVMVAGASTYALLIGLFGGPLIELIYHTRYAQYADLARLMGLIAVPIAAMMTFGSALRAHERPDRELSAYVAATAVTCIGIAAIAAWGLLGAILGLLASQVAGALVMLWWVLRTVGSPQPRTLLRGLAKRRG